MLTQNKSFSVYIYKYNSLSAQGVYVVKKTWNRNEFKAWFENKLSGVLEQNELNEILFRLLEHCGFSKLDWVILNEIEIEESVWCNYINDLISNKPIQYIIGYEYFADEKFVVNEHVLIPRPETEELVNWIVSEQNEKQELEILEIGTGSGCIAISLKKGLDNSKVTATDISENALLVATENANNINTRVEFIQDDIFNSKFKNRKFDIIVSNPPYIPIEEAIHMDSRVKNFEPSIALFTEKDNPLQFYNAIIQFAINFLENKGALYFELHEDYARQVFDVAIANNLCPEIKNDIYGKERMMRIKKDES